MERAKLFFDTKMKIDRAYNFLDNYPELESTLNDLKSFIERLKDNYDIAISRPCNTDETSAALNNDFNELISLKCDIAASEIMIRFRHNEI